MKEKIVESGIDRLRRIVKWCNWQNESYFDELDMFDIIFLFMEVTERHDLDMIEDMKNPTFEEWLKDEKWFKHIHQ